MNINIVNKVNCIFLLLITSLFFPSCKMENDDQIAKVNFSHKDTAHSSSDESGHPLRIAVAARISPEESFYHYSDLLDYVSHKIGRKLLFKQRKTYQEVNELLRLKELDIAFICSGAYIEAKKSFNAEILAIPQINDKTAYHAYIIVHKDSKFESFADLKNRSFAFSDPLSNTGCLYPKYLAAKSIYPGEKYFSRVIYTHAHDLSIQAVANKIVEASSVDSLIFDEKERGRPESVASLKIIKKSIPFGMPPIVVHPEIDPKLKKDLQSIFLNMHKDPEGREISSHLSIDRFVLGDDKDYNVIRKMIISLRNQ